MPPEPFAAPQTVEDEDKVKKAKHARFFWPILLGIVSIVGSLASFVVVFELVHGKAWGMGFGIGLPVFMLATYALIAITPPPKMSPAIEAKARQLSLQAWLLLAYGVFIGLGYNWACVFLWFSQRYAFFSAPVAGVTGLILALYATIGLLVARMTDGNWRKALTIFMVVSVVPALIVLRLGLLR
jgi:hypothetical protein